MMESLSTYYGYWGDENPTTDPDDTDTDELIWGRFTEEQWMNMTCAQRAEAIWDELEDFDI